MALDRMGRAIDPLIPRAMRSRAMRKAHDWVLERLNGEGGLGAIFPAMVNALEVLVLMGVPPDDPRRAHGQARHREAAGRRDRMRPTASPASRRCGIRRWRRWRCRRPAIPRRMRPPSARLDWLVPEQLLDGPQDWRVQKPDVRGGGWAFQFTNTHYPDLDDTAVVAWSMHQARDPHKYATSITRALDWLVGLQSRNGGFAAFDADNTHYILNEIPFADHGALLDPPTSDVTARVVTALAKVGRPAGRRSAGAGPCLPARRAGSRMAPGSAAGARTTSTAPGRC